MVRLRPRLAAIAKMLEPLEINSVADVGCDHGKLTAALLQSGIAKFVYASDISEESLYKAKALISKCNLESMVKFDCVSGLSHLNKVDAIVLAGMGGELIANILDESYECAHNAKAIIMQPMRGVEELREYLYKSFAVFDERIVLDDGRYYQLIAAKAGKTELPEDFPKNCYKYGAVSLNNDSLLPELLNRDLKGLNKRILQAAKKGVSLPELFEETKQIEALLDLYEKGCSHNEKE